MKHAPVYLASAMALTFATAAQAASADVEQQPSAQCRGLMSRYEANYINYPIMNRENWRQVKIASAGSSAREKGDAIVKYQTDFSNAHWLEMDLIGKMMENRCRMPNYNINDYHRRRKSSRP